LSEPPDKGQARPGSSRGRWKKGQSGNPAGPGGMLSKAPKQRLNLAQAMDVTIQALGAQVSLLKRTAEERALAPDERQWLADVTDRLTLIEGQRGRLLLAALALESLDQEQRQKVIAAFTGEALQLTEAKPEGA